MVFYTAPYIYFLFAAGFIFWLLPGERLRTWFLISASGLALFLVQPEFTVFLVCIVIFIHFAARLVQDKKHIGIFLLLLVGLVCMLLGFKYAGSIYASLFSSEHDFAKNYLVPLGISYLSFKLIAFVIDVYRDEIKEHSLEDLLAFILFLPIFPAGPIERFQRFANGRRETFDINHFSEGLLRIALGLFKKIVVVNYILHAVVFERLGAEAMTGMDANGLAVVLFLTGALVYAYFDLSAYADIAIGFSQLFGYQIYENMNYPIFRSNLSDYWNNWHMSLSHWCRNYVYFPVIGFTRNNELALYSSFIVMGLWHEVSLKWFLWGIWHASGIIIYSRWSRWKKRKFKKKKFLPVPVAYLTGMMLTVLYSGLGFAFITQDSAYQAILLLAAIFY